MFRHLYTNRNDLSCKEIVSLAETELDVDYRGSLPVHIRVSELIVQPMKIKAVAELLKQGYRMNRLVVLQNDVNQGSAKLALRQALPDSYKNDLIHLDRLIKSNTVAL